MYVNFMLALATGIIISAAYGGLLFALLSQGHFQ